MQRMPESLQLEPIQDVKIRRRGYRNGVPNRPPGKPIGAVAKITRDVKNGIVDAASGHGSDGEGAGGLTGYFQFLASNYPQTFAGLLGKLIPLQMDARVASVIGQVNVVAVPSDRYLTRTDIEKLRPLEIAHEPESEPTKSEPDAA